MKAKQSYHSRTPNRSNENRPIRVQSRQSNDKAKRNAIRYSKGIEKEPRKSRQANRNTGGASVAAISEIARAEGQTKAKRLPTVRSQEKRKLKRVLPKLRPGWKRYIESAPEDRIAYTFRIEAIVEMRGQYNMSFRAEQYEHLPAQSKGGAATSSIQMLHTRFTPTIQEAVIDLREKKLIMEAYGGVHWLSVDMYRVSGYGPMREKHFKLLGEYDEPEDVPGF